MTAAFGTISGVWDPAALDLPALRGRAWQIDVGPKVAALEVVAAP